MQRDKIVFIIFFILFWVNVFCGYLLYDLNQPQLLEVIFFSVGQGDAIFIETPQSHQILVDGGPGSSVLEKLGQEMPFWDRTIDLIILTHPEHDHISGLIEVLKRYKVGAVLWTGVLKDTLEYQEWIGLIEEKQAEVKIAKVGQRIVSGDVVLNVLHPFESLEGEQIANTNNSSIVFSLVFGEISFLFTGDAYKSIERKLLEKDIDADVLKAGHHGSKTSSDSDFISAVSPEVVVISVGQDNQFGHPHEETLETFKNYGIKVFRTDLDGDIKIIADNKSYEVPNFQN